MTMYLPPLEDARPITLLIADDHPLILAGLAALIRAEPGLQLAGEAVDAPTAVAQYMRLRPDVMLIDLNMPGGGGIDAIRQVRALVPDARIVILSAYDGDEDVHRGLQAGASAYLLKQSGLDEVLQCVRLVAANRRYLAPGLAEKLAQRVEANRLSPRELQILAHLAAGMSNKVIARTENIGVGTVKYHVNNILSKLNVSCRTEAACVAARRGLIHTY
ncbi:response regulator transcription factor [Massilia pinisoli]|uniref:Response regulator transcription factor n=1 Tax=Massilia pinisoli TaxID=1772194 RepID=A0ABT1ZJF9_9BURK|nr:response regulator transcription factor [Massilia pinisoli]MCS0580047.1 response regulator transcription factor [Massilia pinisoli]